MDSTREKQLDQDPLSVRNLVLSAIDSKLLAISGYDGIIWKIRAGYAAILYASLGLLLGAKSQQFDAMIEDPAWAASIMLLVAGFSLAAWFIDAGYLRKKLKVIVTRDTLLSIVLNAKNWENTSEFKHHLMISGEADIKNKEFFSEDMIREYRRQLFWNFAWIHVPLYSSASIICLLVYLLNVS